MKKWIWILSGLVLLIIGGVYVNRHLPEWMIKGGLAYVQKTDYALILESDKVSLNADQKAVAKDVLQTMTYDVKGTRLLGDEAFVTVEVTLVDLMQLIDNEKEAIFKNTLSDWKQTLNDLFKCSATSISSISDSKSIPSVFQSLSVELDLNNLTLN